MTQLTKEDAEVLKSVNLDVQVRYELADDIQKILRNIGWDEVSKVEARVHAQYAKDGNGNSKEKEASQGNSRPASKWRFDNARYVQFMKKMKRKSHARTFAYHIKNNFRDGNIITRHQMRQFARTLFPDVKVEQGVKRMYYLQVTDNKPDGFLIPIYD